jgi:hypothetical protein
MLSKNMKNCFTSLKKPYMNLSRPQRIGLKELTFINKSRTDKNTQNLNLSYILIHLFVYRSVCDGGWTITVFTPARCTNQDLISTKHCNCPKGRNDGRIASLSHRTRGEYKNLPLPPPLLIIKSRAPLM